MVSWRYNYNRDDQFAFDASGRMVGRVYAYGQFWRATLVAVDLTETTLGLFDHWCSAQAAVDKELWEKGV